jgi:putative transposase
MLRGRIRDLTGCCVHVTHRCHNRAFLLKFRRDRRAYVERLRVAARRFEIDILDYVVTSNHVHVLAWVPRGEELSAAMQYVEGDIAQRYNRRKERSGAFWSGRYHPTLIQTGPHLSRCLFYIGLNMVRAGVVAHPTEWGECGVHELLGNRKRYRVLNAERLLWSLGLPDDLDGFRDWYRVTLADLSVAAYQLREPHWTECVAVGGRDWIESMSSRLTVGRRAVHELASSQPLSLAEAAPSYGLSASRRAADALLLGPTPNQDM